MAYHSEDRGPGKVMRCAICDGKFGLVRYYSWRTQLCSRKCVDRFRARRATDGNWLFSLRIAFNQLCQRAARRRLDVSGAPRRSNHDRPSDWGSA